MNLVSLRIKNFLSIADVELKPGQINQVVGRNNQGKTTIIKALQFALKGSSDGSLVKFGEETAEVDLELADDTSIRRRLTSGGKQSVEVMKGPGVLRAPQAILDMLVDPSGFNPLEVLDPKKRADAIMRSIEIKVAPGPLSVDMGIPTEELPEVDWKEHGLKVLEQVHRYFYQRRADANRELGTKKNRWQTYLKDLPTEVKAPLYSRDALSEKRATLKGELAAVDKALDECRRENDAKRKTVMELDKWKNALRVQLVRMESAKAEIAAVEKSIHDIKNKINDDSRALEVPVTDPALWVQKAGKLETEMQELSTHEKDIERVESIRKQEAMVKSLEEEFKSADQFHKELDRRVNILGNDLKAKYMGEADMPIKGLEYKNGEFLVGGVSVDNLSTSHAMRLAIGVARKLAKKTKLICIDGAEALDEMSYAELHKEIEKDGYTYFITKVGAPFEAGYVGNDTIIPMENGQVVQ